jgi:hypothetical protein
MRPLSRNAKVLRYLAEKAPGVGRIHLIKFAYLADYEARRYLGHPITEFRYVRYNHGPWDQSFYAALEELKSHGLLREETIEFPNKIASYRYEATGPAVEYDFSEEDEAILVHVAETYIAWGAKELCDDVVYQTTPMKANVPMNEPLPMDELNNTEHEELGFDLQRMLAGEKSVKAGHFRPLVDVVRELQTRYHP